jgi:apolipoprotein N-acyltransferase
MPLGFAPFGWFWLVPLLLVVLLACWDGQPRREAAWRGFWFGVGAFGTGTYWLYISIAVFGGSPLWLAIFLMLALVLIMACYFALAAWLWVWLRPDSAAVALLAWFPSIWVLTEWLRGWLFTGFPWLSLGYGQIDGPLAGWAPVGGVYAVSLVTACFAGGVALLLLGKNLRERSWALVALVLAVSSSLLLLDRAWTEPSGEPVRVALVQGSISQDRKWLPQQRRPTMRLYEELTFAERDADLVVWPEVAVPAMRYQVDAWLDRLDERARRAGFSLLLGILVDDFDNDQFFNSLISSGVAEGEYHKRHLVPFGEFFPVPDFIREWMRLMSLPHRDTAHGEQDQAPLRAAGLLLSPSICYEDAYGAEQRDFLPQANMLVNVSNDAWFGDSIAPHQHLQIARMRALETGRYMLRTTNTGITAIIDSGGRMQSRLPQFEAGVLRGDVLPHNGATPFVRFGNTPVVLLSLILPALLGLRELRR